MAHMAAAGLTVSDTADGALFKVIASPRASKTEAVGVHDGALKVRLAAAPVDGAANEALAAYLAKRLGVAKSAVIIAKGAAAKRKTVLVKGVSTRRVMEVFAA